MKGPRHFGPKENRPMRLNRLGETGDHVVFLMTVCTTRKNLEMEGRRSPQDPSFHGKKEKPMNLMSKGESRVEGKRKPEGRLLLRDTKQTANSFFSRGTRYPFYVPNSGSFPINHNRFK